MQSSKIILASASPRRKEILAMAGYEFEIDVATGEEVAMEDTPDQLVETLSYNKAKEVAAKYSNGLIIGADTVVAVDGKVLGKPRDRQEAYEMIKSISGKYHSVYTGVTIIEKDEGEESGMVTFSRETKVYVREMVQYQIEEYLDTKEASGRLEWSDKAGGYAIQGAFAKYITHIEGDYYNVVGLPICALCEELELFEIYEIEGSLGLDNE